MAWALRTGRPPRLSFEMGYHALEILNAIIRSTENKTVETLHTTFERPRPITPDIYGGTTDERNLYLY